MEYRTAQYAQSTSRANHGVLHSTYPVIHQSSTVYYVVIYIRLYIYSAGSIGVYCVGFWSILKHTGLDEEVDSVHLAKWMFIELRKLVEAIFNSSTSHMLDYYFFYSARFGILSNHRFTLFTNMCFAKWTYLSVTKQPLLLW